MRTRGIALASCVGVLLGYVVASGVRPAPVNAQPIDCGVSKAFGTFRAVSAESWLIFEDEKGTLRAVDYGCKVQRVFSRQ
jgi:hypothetical protein